MPAGFRLLHAAEAELVPRAQLKPSHNAMDQPPASRARACGLAAAQDPMGSPDGPQWIIFPRWRGVGEPLSDLEGACLWGCPGLAGIVAA